MLGLDRRVARYTWTVLFTFLVVGVVYLIRTTLLIFVLALLFAYLLWPLVSYLDRRLPGRSRVPALTLVYILLVASLIIVGIELGSRVLVEANAMAARVPELISRMNQPLSAAASPTAKSTVVSILRAQLAAHSQDLLSLLPNAALNVLSHAGNLAFLVLVPVLSFFFMKDGQVLLRDVLGAFTKESRRAVAEEIMADINVLLAQYMRALVLLAAVAFVAYGSFLSLIGAPYGLFLAAITFPLEFIPILGPVAAAIIILLVTGLSGFHHSLWILVFLGVFRLFQDYVLSPYLLSSGMELHPLVIIFGVLAGGQIAGIAGSFLSVPVLATLRIVYRQLQKRSPDLQILQPKTESNN